MKTGVIVESKKTMITVELSMFELKVEWPSQMVLLIEQDVWDWQM